MEYDGKLELKATIEVEANPELYKVIDFFNKNLKEKKLIFGLSKKDGTMKISIYET
ncbi:MAG: YpmA family protein [Clostridiales bacterium]|nr:YpmA family protein [Eubacteriales bacterium]MDH7565358.1 YpmA family protein [Clostridiales bacterium]